MINNKLVTKFLLIFSDLFVFGFSIFVAYYVSTPDDFSLDIDEITNSVIRLSLFLFCAGVAVLWFWTIKRHYTYRKPFWDELYDIYVTLIKVALLNLSLLILTYSNLSIATWYYVWGMVIFLFPFGRIWAKYLLKCLGIWELDCVIIGKLENARSAFQALETDKSLGYKVKVFIDPEQEAVFVNPEIGYVPINTFLQDIHHYQKVFIAVEKNQDEILEYWVMKLNRLGYRNISVVPSLGGVPLYGAEISHIFSHEAILLRLHNNLAKRSSRFVKRTFDIFVSTILLIFCMPLFAYLFFKIRRDGGSATYSQVRIGRNGKPFHCYKFRTMVMNSHEILQQLLCSDEKARLEWEQSRKLKHDPRITPIGQFLRRTSLDELPQLWNVLKGEMSLIGPRPVVRSELRFYKENVTYYYMVRPGLSGLWQVSGRSDTSYDRRVHLDAWYVKNWSLWNDIIILYKTVKVVLMRKGAY